MASKPYLIRLRNSCVVPQIEMLIRQNVWRTALFRRLYGPEVKTHYSAKASLRAQHSNWGEAPNL